MCTIEHTRRHRQRAGAEPHHRGGSGGTPVYVRGASVTRRRTATPRCRPDAAGGLARPSATRPRSPQRRRTPRRRPVTRTRHPHPGARPPTSCASARSRSTRTAPRGSGASTPSRRRATSAPRSSIAASSCAACSPRQQIAEIHRVGDLWLRHHEAVEARRRPSRRSGRRAAIDEIAARSAREKAREEARRRPSARRAHAAGRRARGARGHHLPRARASRRRLADRRANVEELATARPARARHARRRGAGARAHDPAAALALLPQRGRREARTTCTSRSPSARAARACSRRRTRSSRRRSGGSSHEHPREAPVEAPAHGFVTGRSTVTNARAAPRPGDVVVNLDLSDFFPTITFPRVRGVFRVARLLARGGDGPRAALHRVAARAGRCYDGTPYWVAVGERALPQGACTSPALSNLVARKLDRRLARHGARSTAGRTRATPTT